jgi:MFS family permease
MPQVQVAWFGTTVSEWATTIALSAFAFGVRGAGGVGLMVLVRSIPAASLSPLLARVIDRTAKRRVVQWLLVFRAVVLGGMAVALAQGPTGVVGVFVLAALDAAACGLYWPAHSALLPEIAGSQPGSAAANAASVAVQSSGILTGASLGGVLVSALPLAGVAASCSGLLAIAATVLVTAPIPPPIGRCDATGTRVAVAPGVVALWSDRTIRVVVIVCLLQTLAVGGLNVLVVSQALEVLDLSDAGIGVLSAAMGVGAVAGAVATLGWLDCSRPASWLRGGLLTWGPAVLLVAALPISPVTAMALMVVGAARAVVDAAVLTLLQQLVEEHVLGRALGVLEGLWWVALGLGAMVASVLVGAIGPAPSFLVVGAAVAVPALCFGPVLSRLDVRTQSVVAA